MYKSALIILFAAMAELAHGSYVPENMGYDQPDRAWKSLRETPDTIDSIRKIRNHLDNDLTEDDKIEWPNMLEFFDDVKHDVSLLHSWRELLDEKLKEMPNIKFRLYVRTSDEPFHLTVENLPQSPYVKGWPTKMYIPSHEHNHVDNREREFFQAYKNESRNINFIVVDLYGSGISTVSLLDVAVKLVNALRKYDDKSYIHIIGHGTGAHSASAIAKQVKPKIARVTGLDPMGTGFSFGIWKNYRLDRNDAKFVDVIITNYDKLGMARPVGQAKFYFNGGVFQPGCFIKEKGVIVINNTCSHDASLTHYINSIYRSNGPMYRATKCNRYRKYTTGGCSDNSVENVGEYASSRANGTYFVQTILETILPYKSNDSYDDLLQKLKNESETLYQPDSAEKQS